MTARELLEKLSKLSEADLDREVAMGVDPDIEEYASYPAGSAFLSEIEFTEGGDNPVKPGDELIDEDDWDGRRFSRKVFKLTWE